MKVPRLLKCAVLTSAVLTVPGIAGAQAKKIPPVEVVATRIPEAPHDVPAAIEVISGDDLRARGATSLRDALALAAGIAIAPGGDGGPASAVPEIWGLREFDAFLLVVDGVPWGGALNPAVATVSLRDVERIEVLRGPAPVTFGATSFVGVIHVVHKAAAATNKYAEVRGGTYGTGGGSIDVPFTLGSYNSRLSADADHEGFKDDHTSFTRGHGLWRVGKTENGRTSWLTADLTILQQDPASPHVREGASLSTATPLDANYNPKNAFINENRFALAAGYDRSVMDGVTWGSTASYTFSGQSMFRGFLVNVSNTANNAAGFRENIDVNHVYADTHLIWPTMSGMKFMAGADLLFAAGEAKGATFSYTTPLSGASQASVTEPTTLDKDAENERRFAGVYGSVEWKLADNFSLNGGLRLNATSEKRGETSPAATNTRISGGVGALLGLWESGADHLRAFASYRNTFKPAAFDFGLAENEGILKPETSNSYETGLKFTGNNGQFDAELSAFRMDFENLVTSSVVGNLPSLTNSGSTRFQGVELATDIRLPYSFLARGTVSLHDGKFVNYLTDFNGVNTQLGGKRFEMSARQLASAGLVYAPEMGIIGSATMNYSGDRYLNKRNTALAKSFTTFDAGVGYRADRFEVRIDGRNLSDQRDPISESEFGDAQYYRMPARSFRTGLSWKY